jgi:hypothetical protein
MKKQSITVLRVAVLGAMSAVTLASALPSASAQGSGQASEHNSLKVHRDNTNGNYNPTYNPNQVALLRWYQANTGPTNFLVPPTSAGTVGIAFDGTNIWVSSYSTNRLNEFSINGQLLKTINVGGAPLGLAFDGSKIWVANIGSGTLQTVQVVPPYTVTTVNVSGLSQPYFLAFDGSRMWVTDTGNNKVFAVGINSPYTASNFPVGMGPTGIAFDGDCMWVTDTNDGTVWVVPDPYGFNCTIGAGPVNWKTSSSAQPFYVVYDGINMWVSVRFANQVVELDDSINPGYLLNTINVGTTPQGMAFDGAYVWVGNSGGSSVTKLTASNNPNAAAGTVVGTYPVNGGPQTLAFDGASIWVTLGGVFVGKM